MDSFKRTPFESSDDLVLFKRALSREAEPVDPKRGAEPFSPGPYIKAFYTSKPKRFPQTDTEKAVFASILAAPLPLEYVSNFLVYSRVFNRLDSRTKKALYSLVRGGGVKILRTYHPDTYWLLAND
jgi:hypothetical protein